MRARVDEQQIAVFERRVIFDVMQNTGVCAPANNRIIRNTRRAVILKIIFDNRFNLIFIHTRLGFFHCQNVRLSRNIG